MNRHWKPASLVLAALALAACEDASGPKDYLTIAGGGLAFNYRYSEATLIIVGKVASPLPSESIVEALFEIPGGKERQSVRWASLAGKLTYKLQSAPLTGIVKGGSYGVTLQVLDKDGKVLDSDQTRYVSDVDQSLLPAKPLADGPAYFPRLDNL